MATEAFAAPAIGLVARNSFSLPQRSAASDVTDGPARKLISAPVQQLPAAPRPRIEFSVDAKAAKHKAKQRVRTERRFQREDKIDQPQAARVSTPALRYLPSPTEVPHEHALGGRDGESTRFILERITLKAAELDRVATRVGIAEGCGGLPDVLAMPPGASAMHFAIMAKLAREVRGTLAYYRLSAQQLFEFERDLDRAAEERDLPDDVVSSARSMLAAMSQLVEEGRRACEEHRARTVRALRQKIVRGEALVAARDEADAAGLSRKQRMRVITEALARIGTGSKSVSDNSEEEAILPPFEPSLLGMARVAMEKIRNPCKNAWEEEIPECLLWRMFNQEEGEDFLERETLHRWIRLGQDVWDERLSYYPEFKGMQEKRFRQVLPVGPTVAAAATFASAVAAVSAASLPILDAATGVLQGAAVSGAVAAAAGLATLPAATFYSFMSVPWAPAKQQKDEEEDGGEKKPLGPMSMLGVSEFVENYGKLMAEGPDAIPAGRRRGRDLINTFETIRAAHVEAGNAVRAASGAVGRFLADSVKKAIEQQQERAGSQ